ncbi:MAG TPA: hypothetical protein VH164_06570 [Ktedonobacteraceae bacterium]|nr:hypothetical protein [Ktedonobacteraceae bacterium]
MKQRSPTLEGFRAIVRQPSFGLAEIAWRWSFGAAAGLLLLFSFFEYLDTLPVSNGDLLLLRTGQPILISRAVLHIFRGSAFRVVETAIVLSLTLGAAWIVVASLGRAATLKALLAHFREVSTSDKEKNDWRLRSLLGLNVFRLGATLAATIGCLAAFLLAGAASRPTDPAPGSALLIFLTVTMLVWLAWSTLNWVLSLAAIFVVAHGRDEFGAIAATVDLCLSRPGSVFAAGTWFGLAHITAFVVASSVLAFPLGFAAVLPEGVVLGGVLLVTLLYFAVADFLYIGRLAAYVAMVEMPELPVSAEVTPPYPPQGSTYPHREPDASPGVDASELILSDVPLVT